jgi:hypothetical protein
MVADTAIIMMIDRSLKGNKEKATATAVAFFILLFRSPPGRINKPETKASLAEHAEGEEVKRP